MYVIEIRINLTLLNLTLFKLESQCCIKCNMQQLTLLFNCFKAAVWSPNKPS